MNQNAIFRKKARTALANHWTSMALFTLVYMVIMLIVRLPYMMEQVLAKLPLEDLASILEVALEDLVSIRTIVSLPLLILYLFLVLFVIPVTWSFEVSFLTCLREKKGASLNKLFVGFSDYSRIFMTDLAVGIYLIFWTCLLIVPGIIKSYSYAMVNYILLDDPKIESGSAISKSSRMMEGHRWQLFKLDLPFILLVLAGILTLGIAWLWIIPWWNTSRAVFYEDLHSEYEEQEVLEIGEV